MWRLLVLLLLTGAERPRPRVPVPPQARGRVVIVAEPPPLGKPVDFEDLDVRAAIDPRFPRWVEDVALAQCRVRIDIEPDGVPLRVVSLNCDARFFAPAEEALLQWRFVPVRERVEPIPVNTELIVEFHRR